MKYKVENVEKQTSYTDVSFTTEINGKKVLFHKALEAADMGYYSGYQLFVDDKFIGSGDYYDFGAYLETDVEPLLGMDADDLKDVIEGILWELN